MVIGRDWLQLVLLLPDHQDTGRRLPTKTRTSQRPQSLTKLNKKNSLMCLFHSRHPHKPLTFQNNHHSSPSRYKPDCVHCNGSQTTSHWHNIPQDNSHLEFLPCTTVPLDKLPLILNRTLTLFPELICLGGGRSVV